MEFYIDEFCVSNWCGYFVKASELPSEFLNILYILSIVTKQFLCP